MEFRFDRKEPGVWISAGTHVALLALALFSVAAPAVTGNTSAPRSFIRNTFGCCRSISRAPM